MSKSLFITGTGTDIGKTYITALIVKKLIANNVKVAYFKPAMSGNEKDAKGEIIPGDSTWVKNISMTKQDITSMCPYVYENAVSPHLAGQIENNSVEIAIIKEEYKKLQNSYDYITIEGAGGIACPLSFGNEHMTQDELVKNLKLPCLIVADAGLGTINLVVLTVHYMKSQKIPIKGIIFNNFHPNNFMEEDNIKMCEALTGIKVIACVKKGDKDIDISVEDLQSFYN